MSQIERQTDREAGRQRDRQKLGNRERARRCGKEVIGSNQSATAKEAKKKKLTRYGVVKKKVNRKREEKMHSIVKMTSQRAENLVHVQQHHGKHFYKKIFF